MNKKTWNFYRTACVVLGVLLILGFGLFLIGKAFQAALDWAFGPIAVNSFSQPSVEQVMDKAQLTVPENAKLCCGAYQGWQDQTVDLVFSMPYTQDEALLPEYLKSALSCQSREWDGRVYIVGTERDSLLARMPDVAGTFGSDRYGCIVEVAFSAPKDGFVYVRLHCTVD